MAVEEMATFKGDACSLANNVQDLSARSKHQQQPAQISLSTLLSDVATFDVASSSDGSFPKR